MTPRVTSLGRVSIVGAGHVGTMLGMALSAAPSDAGIEEVTLFDRDRVASQASLERGAGDRVVADVEEALEADTVVFALPVPEIVKTIVARASLLRPDALLIDTGSAKRVVVETMRRHVPANVHAVGGHPMAGGERPGPTGAQPRLLQSTAFVLTPVRDDSEALARGRVFATAVGSYPLQINAETHDRIVARTSHLPHLAAFALASVGNPMLRDPTASSLVATGYRSATRLTASDPDMVAGFLWANATEVRRALRELVDSLMEAEAVLGEGPEVVAKWLTDTSLREGVG